MVAVVLSSLQEERFPKTSDIRKRFESMESPLRELVIATQGNEMPYDDAGNDELVIKKQSSSPKNQVYCIEDNGY